MKSQYEEEVEATGKDYGFERELVAYLRTLVDECDRKIKRGLERLVLNTEVDALESSAKVDEEIKGLMVQVGPFIFLNHYLLCFLFDS